LPKPEYRPNGAVGLNVFGVASGRGKVFWFSV
jgi:hypothetical protein